MSGPAVPADVLAFLADPDFFGGQAPTHEETHGAHVFIGADRALKIKKPVRYPFLDYSTLAKRQQALERELEINQRFAPRLYRGLRAVVSTLDGLRLVGSTPDPAHRVVEWVLEMASFAPADQFDRMLAAGRLTPALVEAMADAMVAQHEAAAIRTDYFRPEQVLELAKGLVQSQSQAQSGALVMREVARWSDLATREIRLRHKLIEQRVNAGRVRVCHGDLHLRNWALFEGRPTAFDAIEFDEAISTTDILYDLAFPIMDLIHLQRLDLANLLFNRYVETKQRLEGLKLMPLFLSLRAAVRAAVAGLQGQSGLAYQNLSLEALTDRPEPMLIAIGGRSGSGKSTLARLLAPNLAPLPGAVIVRADGLRKRLFDKFPEQHLPAAAYRSAVSRRVYLRLYALARAGLRAGCQVVVDATFLGAEGRERIEAVAERAGARFVGFWMEAPPAILKERAGDRYETGGDASDADASVVRRQLREATGRISWRRIDSTQSLERQLADAKAALE
jgi:uncharacterized protein